MTEAGSDGPWLADTTFLIDYLAGDPGVEALLERRDGDPGVVTTPVNLKDVAVGEMVVADADPALIDRRFGWLDVLPLDRHHAYRAAAMEAEMRRTGSFDPELIPDIVTAAVAVENGLPALTRNVADFEAIPEVAVESY
jgi:predicted nucleic acid-binding protein